MHARRVVKAEHLLERLTQLGDRVSAKRVEQARQKLAHESMRAGLPAERLARLMPVVREMRAGGYRRFGYGVQGAMRDLIESV